MNELEINNSIFESIKHIDENNNEYWFARELMSALEYSKWERFSNALEKAKISCKECGYSIDDHFPGSGKMIIVAKGAKRKIKDYKLSRYACYLIAQNADSRKKVVALAQTYFTIQTRRQELLEIEYEKLSEDQKRIYQRNLTKKGNYSLNQTAKIAGVKNFDKFHNYGYKGLYNGEIANDIAKRKGLRYREDILYNMCSKELVDNPFRIVQTEAKLKNSDIKDEKIANNIHYKIGKNIREVIIKNGGTIPEKLPTPNKSIKQIKKENLYIENKKLN